MKYPLSGRKELENTADITYFAALYLYRREIRKRLWKGSYDLASEAFNDYGF